MLTPGLMKAAFVRRRRSADGSSFPVAAVGCRRTVRVPVVASQRTSARSARTPAVGQRVAAGPQGRHRWSPRRRRARPGRPAAAARGPHPQPTGQVGRALGGVEADRVPGLPGQPRARGRRRSPGRSAASRRTAAARGPRRGRGPPPAGTAPGTSQLPRPPGRRAARRAGRRAARRAGRPDRAGPAPCSAATPRAAGPCSARPPAPPARRAAAAGWRAQLRRAVGAPRRAGQPPQPAQSTGQHQIDQRRRQLTRSTRPPSRGPARRSAVVRVGGVMCTPHRGPGAR